jgi:uncharacterized protein (TIGR02266 family)
MQPSRSKNAPADVESGTHASGPNTRESGSMGTAASRREHARHDIELEVTMESETNFYLGLTENISEGGLFIATHVLKPLGTQIGVSFALPDSEVPVRTIGTVRWVREYSETSDTSPGMGVRFEQLTPTQMEQIRHFLSARAPLFHDDD